MMIPLNLHPFRVFFFKDVTKSGQLGECGTSHVVFNQEIMHWQCRVNTCSVMVEKPISWISWFRSFDIHFPADTVMFKCNYVGLLVVLGAQIHSAKSPQSLYLEKKRSFSTHFNKPVLPFLGMKMIDGTLLRRLAWFLCLTFKPMSHCDCQSLSLNGILSLFPTSLEGPGTTWFSFCSSLNRWDMKCGTNLTDVQTLLQIAFEYPNKIPNMLTTLQIVTSVFYDKFFLQFTFLMLFTSQWTFRVFSIVNKVCITFHLRKSFKTLCSCNCLLSKSCFQHSKYPIVIFSHFKAEYEAQTLFFQLCQNNIKK